MVNSPSHIAEVVVRERCSRSAGSNSSTPVRSLLVVGPAGREWAASMRAVWGKRWQGAIWSSTYLDGKWAYHLGGLWASLPPFDVGQVAVRVVAVIVA